MSKTKITELTPEQEAQLEVYYKEWLAVGMATGPANEEEVLKGVIIEYKSSNLEPPGTVIFVRSPFECLEMVKAGSIAAGAARIYNRKGTKWTKYDGDVTLKVQGNVDVGSFCFGNHEAGWLGFYQYMREVLGLKEETEEMQGIVHLARNAGWLLQFEHCVFVCDRPSEIHVDVDGNPHNPLGAAIKYSDGHSLFMLHGVKVPEWLACTPADEIDPHKIMEIENVDQRREGVRKVGVERVMSKMGAKKVDEWQYKTKDGREHPYELLTLMLPGASGESKVLKMLNPSMPGVYHVEFVWPQVKDCKQALAWRNTGSQDMKVLESWKPPQYLS